jgi:autotransporter-associated beta strand protein
MNGSGGIHLGGVQTFQIADTTGDAAPDLVVDMILGARGSNPGDVGGVKKTGAGTLRINSASSYDGATIVAEGTLIVSGSLTATSSLTVQSAATLAGNGPIAGPVTIQSGGHHALEVAAIPAAQVIRTIGGVLTLDAGNILDLSASAAPADGTYLLVTATGGIVGTPGTVNLPSGVTGTVAINGNNLELTVGATNDYAAWASSFAGFTDTAPGNDPDSDGLTNFEEYAFGLNPTKGSSVAPVIAPNQTTGTFTYTRRKQTLTGITYGYESSTSLSAWNPFTPVSSASDNGNPLEIITVTLPPDLLTESAVFLRVKAVQP